LTDRSLPLPFFLFFGIISSGKICLGNNQFSIRQTLLKVPAAAGCFAIGKREDKRLFKKYWEWVCQWDFLMCRLCVSACDGEHWQRAILYSGPM